MLRRAAPKHLLRFHVGHAPQCKARSAEAISYGTVSIALHRGRSCRGGGKRQSVSPHPSQPHHARATLSAGGPSADRTDQRH